MSKKDYEKIAEDLRNYWENRKENCETEAEQEKAEQEFSRLLKDLSETFKRENEHFIPVRFYEAVGF